MNERLKQLAIEAGLRFTQLMSYPTVPVVDGKETDLARFADMIVDECCLKLLGMDEKTQGQHNYYKHAALEVKRHFEV